MTIFRDVADWWRTSLARRYPQMALTRAQRLLCNGQPEAAVKLLAAAASARLPAAAYELGICYLAGRGMPQDSAQAVQWLTLAARHGDVDAQVKLAGLLVHGIPGSDHNNLFPVHPGETIQNFPEAAMWARRAAEAGAAGGMALLAFILSAGPAELRNEAEAKHWYACAAAKKLPQGQLGYGLILLAQADSSTEAQAALAGIREAAAAGLAQAHYCLATLLETGTPLIDQDIVEAMQHYRAAAKGGLTHAMSRLGLALMDGTGMTANAEEGETWLRRAALQGDVAAALRLGKLYAAQDVALPPNYMEAARWFKLAAEAGSPEAANAMGKLHLLGKGVEPDKAAALAWFNRAASATGIGAT